MTDNIKILGAKQDVEMEDELPHTIPKQLFSMNTHDDMEVDQDMEIEDSHNTKKPINQKFQYDPQMSDQEKLDYFHNVLEISAKQSLIEEDKKTSEDPLECSEYVTEIFSYLKKTELDFIAQPGYMKKQADINEKMRAILIDWLVEVHLKFKLYPETLYLTVNLIDRYLEKEEVLRQHLQLVGVTAMLIASKYEEIYAPEVRDFVYITDKAYTKEEILSMEYKMLTTLNFNITTPSSFRFLERIYKL